MEDWQGCLSPACQKALKSACESVTRRGGYAVTVEDFLLAMLDEIPELGRFLARQGVDLDELTRTIQCEQPVVTAVASDNLLSSQLMYWIHCTREISGAVWLDWPTLLQVLVRGAERLQEKAYVAVLELVTRWPLTGADVPTEQRNTNANTVPVVMADAGWLGLAEDVSVALSAAPDALIWVTGARGSGKSSWLKTLMANLPAGAIEVDIRREADILSDEQPAVPGLMGADAIAPVLVLDNVSPADLKALMETEFSVARELVTSFPGPLVMLSAQSPDDRCAAKTVQRLLGRSFQCFAIPTAGPEQKLAILTAHQPVIEKRWQIEMTPDLLDYAAAIRHPSVGSPGAMLAWVERAAARLSLQAEQGPLQARVIEGRAETIRRQWLLALARKQSDKRFRDALESLAVERAASEVAWHERKREGSLRLLKTDDLRFELEQRLAAGNGARHYNDKPYLAGELELARP